MSWHRATSFCDGCGKEYWPTLNTWEGTKIYCPGCQGARDANKSFEKHKHLLTEALNSDDPA